jgi:hypothetical protein
MHKRSVQRLLDILHAACNQLQTNCVSMGSMARGAAGCTCCLSGRRSRTEAQQNTLQLQPPHLPAALRLCHR